MPASIPSLANSPESAIKPMRGAAPREESRGKTMRETVTQMNPNSQRSVSARVTLMAVARIADRQQSALSVGLPSVNGSDGPRPPSANGHDGSTHRRQTASDGQTDRRQTGFDGDRFSLAPFPSRGTMTARNARPLAWGLHSSHPPS